MAALYIPYVVGSSAIAYFGKEIISYMYREDSLEKIVETENNKFLKNDNDNEGKQSPVFDIIENEEKEELPVYGPCIKYDDECIDRPYTIQIDNKDVLDVEPNDSIPFPELNKVKSKPKSVSFSIKNDNYKENRNTIIKNMAFKPVMSTIQEEEDEEDKSIELKKEIILPTNLHKCSKCDTFLPLKCFSKSQKKKTPKVWKCKVCLKLTI